MKKLILASKSPRRKEILSQCGFTFEVFSADADERIHESDPEMMVQKLSERKAYAAWELWKEQKEDQDQILILGSDTIVSYENEILGKPEDSSDAFRMLSLLSGKTHQVYTGVTLLWQEKDHTEQVTFSDKTDVTFYPMTESEILTYIATGECDDKAGAYAVQGYGMKYIQKLNGDYHTVVGLPAAKLYQIMKEHKLL